MPLASDCLEGVERRQTGCRPLLGRSLERRLPTSLLADVGGVDAGADQLASFFGLLAREAQACGGIVTQAQSVAPTVQALVEGPAMRAAVDIQLEVQTGAIGQTIADIAGLDRLDRGVRGDEVVCRAGTPTPRACNVNSESAGTHGICVDKKKP